MSKNYKNLDVWKKAVELANLVYSYTANFPKEEIYGLSSQIRRCAVSIASNIAEGHERNSTKEFIQFLGIARGSLAELETQLIIAQAQSFGNPEKAKEIELICEGVQKMLWKLMAVLNDKISSNSRVSNLASLTSEAI